MTFVNNWSRPVELGASDTSLPLDLPDGGYRLTITDSLTEPTRWEIIDALVAGGTATLTRGREATLVQTWPDGSVIYSAVTAGQLNGFEQRITQLENGSGGGGGGEFGPWITLPAEPGWGVDILEYRLEPGNIVRFQFSVYAEGVDEFAVLAILPAEIPASGQLWHRAPCVYRFNGVPAAGILSLQEVDQGVGIVLSPPSADFAANSGAYSGSVAIAL